MLLKEEKGAALPLVIMIIAVLMILGSTFMFVSGTESRQMIRQQNKAQAYFYARSGLEAVYADILQDINQLSEIPFSFYGNLDSGLNRILGVYESEMTNHDILVTIEAEGERQAVMTAIGNVEGVKEKIQYSFRYTLGDAEGDEPSIPPNLPNAGSNELDWYHNNNGKIRNKTAESIESVIFSTGTVTDITLQARSGDYKAPAMYFLDEHSLTVTNNSTLTLGVDFIAFLGDIYVGTSGNKGHLVLTPNNSNLYIGEQNDGPYGIVYLGGEIRLGNSVIFSKDRSGYYLFPSETNLSRESDLLNKLIHINDIRNFNYDGLGVEIEVGGASISPGTFQ